MPRKSTSGSSVNPRRDTWLKNALKKADPNSELIILENPRVRAGLDQYLIEIWPTVKQHLESTGHFYTPEGDLEIESKPGYALVRTGAWMLHESTQAICRGTLECHGDHWMLLSEFFLSMPSNTDQRFVMEIIGNSRFGGNPPELTIHKHSPVNYYQIQFHSGNGESWGPQSIGRIIERIKKNIDANVAMNDFAIDGEWNEEIVGEFLTHAYEAYEAH